MPHCGSVRRGITGSLGEQAMERRNRTQGFLPQRSFVAESEQLRRCGGNDPCVLLNFLFELSGAPTGVADEGAHQCAGFFLLHHGLLGGDLLSESKSLSAIPPECGKKQLILCHWPGLVDADMAEWVEGGVLEDIADTLTGGLIEN